MFRFVCIGILLLLTNCQWKLSEKQPFNPYTPELSFVVGGTFKMGSETGINNDERPVHTVSVGSFYIGRHEVTVKQYRNFCTQTQRIFPSAPSWGWQDNYPIVYVSWEDAMAYCEWLSTVTGKSFRLPTEAEWEFAARGGKNNSVYEYAGSNNPDEIAWYESNAKTSGAHSVKQKKANELGLFDMSGNVWEWCYDNYGETYYQTTPAENPKGPGSAISRVIRGGSYFTSAEEIRVANRYANFQTNRQGIDFGFRVVQDP